MVETIPCKLNKLYNINRNLCKRKIMWGSKDHRCQSSIRNPCNSSNNSITLRNPWKVDLENNNKSRSKFFKDKLILTPTIQTRNICPIKIEKNWLVNRNPKGWFNNMKPISILSFKEKEIVGLVTKAIWIWAVDFHKLLPTVKHKKLRIIRR